jgi:hypothetical protein
MIDDVFEYRIINSVKPTFKYEDNTSSFASVRQTSVMLHVMIKFITFIRVNEGHPYFKYAVLYHKPTISCMWTRNAVGIYLF